LLGGDDHPYPAFPHPPVPIQLNVQLPPFLSIMPVVTRETNANAHPGHIVQKVQRKKRTKQEIADDKAKAQAKSIAAKQEAARKHHDMISTIAGLKATVEREEQAIRAHANRPDLQYSSPSVARTALTRELQVPVRARERTDIMEDLDIAG
jgi:hypothetical protein